MAIQDTPRSMGSANPDPPIPTTLAASHAPVVEPTRPPQPRPITPQEAEDAARQVSHARAERTRKLPADGQQAGPVVIPSMPPARTAPARLTPLVLVLAQMLLDVVMLATAFALAYWLRFESDIERKVIAPDTATYVAMLSTTVGTVLLTFYFSKLYSLKRGASRVDEFYKIAAAVSIGTVLSLATNSLLIGERFKYSNSILLLGWLLAILFVTSMRLFYSLVVGELRKRGLDRSRVLVVGSGPTAMVVVERLKNHRTLGYEVVGIIDNSGSESVQLPSVGKIPILGNLTRLADVVRKRRVDEVIVALQGASDKQLRDIIGLMQDETVSIKIYPDAFQLMTQNEVSVGELSGIPLLTVKDVALRGWNRRLKRAFDFVFSLFVLIVTSPFMLLIALAIKLSGPGPVFFIQERVGLDSAPFQLVKFRTMKQAVDEDEVPKLREGMPGWTVPNDPRRTAIGAFLRRFSLDELPQFFNVLIGEMSVVGPRPEQPEYVEEFAKSIEDYLRRHREKAGITGWAQVNGLRGDSSIEVRTQLDLYYVENWSILFDLKIIVRTLVTMLRGKNAY